MVPIRRDLRCFIKVFRLFFWTKILPEKIYRTTFIKHLGSRRIGTILCQNVNKYQENPTQRTRAPKNCRGRAKNLKFDAKNFFAEMETQIPQGTHTARSNHGVYQLLSTKRPHAQVHFTAQENPKQAPRAPKNCRRRQKNPRFDQILGTAGKKGEYICTPPRRCTRTNVWKTYMFINNLISLSHI